MALFAAAERWLLSPRLRGAAWQAAVARAGPDAVLWVEHAEGLDARAALELGRAAAGHPLVLSVDVAALRRLALGRLAAVCGAAAVVVRAPVGHAAAAARALRARTEGVGATPGLALGLELLLGPDDAAALASAPWSALLAADLDITLQPAAAATTRAADDDGAAASGTTLDGWTAALAGLPAAVALGEGFAALVPGRGAERPGPRPPWIAALAEERASRPLQAATFTADGESAESAGAGGALRAPRWRDAAEWIALELELRRVWRIDLPAALLDSLERAARQAGFAFHVGVAVDIDAAGLWDAAGSERRIAYVGPDPSELRTADALERDTLALASRPSADGGVGPQAHEIDRAAENDRAMARLLGYPDCCRDAFIEGHRTWTTVDAAALAESAYFALRALRATDREGGEPDRRLDFVSPLAGATTIRHYPCRLDCPASLALAAAIDAEAWRRDPGRRLRDADARADATLIFATGAALPLRGRVEAGALYDPTPLLGRRTWAPHWQALVERVLPVLSGVRQLASSYPPAGPGGVTLHESDGVSRPLALPGGFPHPQDHPEFPRLLVFSR
ncbi:MAG: hypothetical protein H6747_16115 [Deltaproteobacteria bacterium]|nr:hypothetical protein [Deltaproteobacteria bacterium]